MKRIFARAGLLFVCVLALGAYGPASVAPVVGPKLSRSLQMMRTSDSVVVWVFFKDKGPASLTGTYTESVVSTRSFARRLKVRDSASAVDASDWPVNPAYVTEVALLGKVRHPSRWFNAVSVLATKEGIEKLAKLPFVARLELTARLKTQSVPTQSSIGSSVNEARQNPDSEYYGPSLRQVAQLNVPAVHAQGNNGQGVLIALMDAGFPLLTHEAFASIKILATYDFVEHRASVTPSDGSGSHGTMTLSTIGGFIRGKLIGPAFGATYVLARTEVEATETPAEEDNWVAAIEWADSIGVDITSTSLGYLAYDDPYTDWTWKDMNGNTTLITRAADMAVSKGILVVNSAGNTPNFEVTPGGIPLRDSLGKLIRTNHNTLGAPADGDSVLTAGAIDPNGQRAYFSSVGPTTSNPPRIKPDVMAMGVGVYVASPAGRNVYRYVDGTSFSCPLTAGIVALMLRDVPGATPMQVIEALHASGDRAARPDNEYGWGTPNVAEAIQLLKKIVNP